MPSFLVIAINAQGKEIKQTWQGDSPRQVREQLRTQGLTPLQVTPLSQDKKSQAYRRLRLSPSDLALLTRQLATLLNAGLPLADALTAVAEQNDNEKIARVLHLVREQVLEGHSFASSLRLLPRCFSPLYCATIASGEKAGDLDKILEQLAEHVEKQQATRQKVHHALIYPSLMTLVSLCIVVFLLVYVVPTMVQVFDDNQQSLPLATHILLALSAGLKRWGLFFLGLVITSVLLFKYQLTRHSSLRRRWHGLLLRLPCIGKIIRLLNTARYARSLGILSNAGVPISDAMLSACHLIRNNVIHDATRQACQHVQEGAAIHRALKQTSFFSAMSLHLIASGENSGQLEAMLLRVADTQEGELSRWLDSMLSLFEPLLILLMGGVVLFIVLALLLPIFSLNQLTG